MKVFEEYEKRKRIERQPTCKHKYLIGKSNGSFQCVDCDKQLKKLPRGRNLAF